MDMKQIPHLCTVELMARELGCISDIQSAEMALSTQYLTLGFDSTTQQGVYINCVHLTSQDKCHVIAIDQSPGCTSDDYQGHICQSLDNLARTYSEFHATNYNECRRCLIENITNTMSDRAQVNHLRIQKKFKDGTGGPLGFTNFLDDNKLPRVEYLENLDGDSRKHIVKWYIHAARKMRNFNRLKHLQMRKVMSKRIASKCQKKEDFNRRKVEKTLSKNDTSYVISYRKTDETENEAVHFKMKKVELTADVVSGELIFS
ncbi:hypothetical protein Btru_073126 [Bulinus truncatus]|nr:hypothetical protein Btru_073126 [Bulinus truncatus]